MTTLQEARASFPTNTAWWNNGAAAPELEKYYAAGESYIDLARRFGTNPDDVYKRCSELGLTRKYPRKGGNHMRIKAKAAQVRTCLRCRRPFASAGNHNHICPRCARANASQTGLDR